MKRLVELAETLNAPVVDIGVDAVEHAAKQPAERQGGDHAERGADRTEPESAADPSAPSPARADRRRAAAAGSPVELNPRGASPVALGETRMSWSR